MIKTMTFSQCLSSLMEKHQLTLGNLALMIGSRADLKHILADDATPTKRSRIFEKLKESRLFDKADYEQLAHSLEISRLGVERYRFQQATASILLGKTLADVHVIHTDEGVPLAERLSVLYAADKIEIICFNSCYHYLFSSLAPLFEDSKRDILLRHYIQSDSTINIAAEYVDVVMPVLFDERYVSFYRVQTVDSKIPSIGGNQLFIKAIIGNEIIEMYFVFTANKIAYEMPNASASHLFSFIDRVLRGAYPQPVPIKETSPYKPDFTSLCMTFLSHELNRATYYIGSDLCFQQTPTEIAIAAFRGKGLSSDQETNRIIERTLSIHEQRYQNQYSKKKPTYRIMTKAGCSRFLETGETADHFVGFRPFTPEERKVIFENMLNAAHANKCFIPLLLRDVGYVHRYNLVCYDKLGVSIDDKNTDYDISSGYRSVFLMLPEFTKQYLSYYMDILVNEKCHTREESLGILEQMYQDFITQHQL